jgi:serine/threonine protein kinase
VKAYKDENDEYHAIKVVRVNSKQKRELFEQEIDIHAKLRHPCILAFQGYSPPDEHKEAVIMTEFMPNGTLEENIKPQKAGGTPRLTNPTKLAKIVIGVVLGMRFMHLNGAIHRDLKPSNLFLDEFWRVRIGDFGSGRFADELTNQAGATHYMAPECFGDKGYTNMVDVYSFGLILYEIIVGQPVFSPEKNQLVVMALTLDGVRADIPTTVPH